MYEYRVQQDQDISCYIDTMLLQAPQSPTKTDIIAKWEAEFIGSHYSMHLEVISSKGEGEDPAIQATVAISIDDSVRMESIYSMSNIESEAR